MEFGKTIRSHPLSKRYGLKRNVSLFCLCGCVCGRFSARRFIYGAIATKKVDVFQIDILKNMGIRIFAILTVRRIFWEKRRGLSP